MTDTPTTPTDVEALIKKALHEHDYDQNTVGRCLCGEAWWSGHQPKMIAAALASARSVPQPTGTSEELLRAEARGAADAVQTTVRDYREKVKRARADGYAEGLAAAVPPAGAGREQIMTAFRRMDALAAQGDTPEYRAAFAEWQAVAVPSAALPSVPTPTVEVEEIARIIHPEAWVEPLVPDTYRADSRNVSMTKARAVHALLAGGGLSVARVVEVHHHDIEAHAASFNEGFDEAVAQGLAVGLSVEQIKAEALREAAEVARAEAPDEDYAGATFIAHADWLDARAAALVAGTGEQP